MTEDNDVQNPYPFICPNCNKKYPLPPKACSCESLEIIDEIKYYFLLEDPAQLDESMSIIEMDVKEISQEEFMNLTKEGFYVEETFVPGIETVGTFKREIKKQSK